jgi:hypothetical protein
VRRRLLAAAVLQIGWIVAATTGSGASAALALSFLPAGAFTAAGVALYQPRLQYYWRSVVVATLTFTFNICAHIYQLSESGAVPARSTLQSNNARVQHSGIRAPLPLTLTALFADPCMHAAAMAADARSAERATLWALVLLVLLTGRCCSLLAARSPRLTGHASLATPHSPRLTRLSECSAVHCILISSHR